jgi:ABC-type maltose transport system permease subunit
MIPLDSSGATSEASLPTCAKVATGLQVLIASIVLVIWGAWASWGRFPNSLVVASAIFLPALVFCTAAAFGLSRGRMFGWVMALVGNGASAAILLFFAGPFGILPAALLVYLLLPNVRGFYVRNYYQ